MPFILHTWIIRENIFREIIEIAIFAKISRYVVLEKTIKLYSMSLCFFAYWLLVNQIKNHLIVIVNLTVDTSAHQKIS